MPNFNFSDFNFADLLSFNKEDLMSSLMLMGQGMLGIFLVMAAIALIVFLITKIKK